MPHTSDDPTVGELSEGAILARILARTGSAAAALVGPGDDAAVLRTGGRVVVTADTLVHGPDFRLAWSSGRDLGWKSAAVNLADVAAMGAVPTALVVSLAMPKSTRVSFVEEIAAGLAAACDELAPGCAVVGGDLTSSDTLTIAVTALGDMADAEPVLRHGARAGDVLALAGEIGPAARGIRLLFERFVDENGVPVPVDDAALSDDERTWIAAQLRPRPPVGLGPVAARAGATAMMDVSDGLAIDAGRMAVASDVTMSLRSDLLGPHPGWAVDGGEDHALLAAFPASVAVPRGFGVVGEVIDRGAADVLYDGRPAVAGSGWDPYRDWDEGAD